MARPVRIEYPGAVYHVIVRGNNRQAIFRDDGDRNVYMSKLSHYCSQRGVHLLCYCVLPNHVHLLVETPQGNLSKMMQAFQTSYSRYFNWRHSRTGHVFEQRYKALLVDRDTYLLQVSRYIHINPVEAKVVTRPQDYRWSSYRAYLSGAGSQALKREVILGQFGGKPQERVAKYREFVEGALRGKSRALELPIREQAFVGDEQFVEEVRRRGKQVRGGGTQQYVLGDIAEAVCEVVGIKGEQLRQPIRDARIQRARELFMFVGRRYSGASLLKIIARLGVRDVATVTHGVRRAELRLEKERDFRRQAEQILRRLSHSPIQA